MGQLYGMFNEASREWIDGVLAYTVRKCCSDRSTQKHWIMFDGPVDAIWIENMNTVLDDNKKLCLNSGQILTLTPHMTMMFEVEDLAVASPATVSRCGMVYIEPAALGLLPLFYKWKQELPAKIKENKKLMKLIEEFVVEIVVQMIDYVKRNCKEMISSISQNLLQSFFRIMNCFLCKYVDNEIVKVTIEDIAELEQMILSMQLFALTWSVGASTDYGGRLKFNENLKVIASKKSIPLLSSYYNFFFNVKSKEFEPWTALYSSFEINQNLSYHEIIIPTTDSERSTYLTKMLLTNNYHVMLPGPTGTGKSINSYNLLTSGLDETYQYISIVFSAQTSANQTQDTIDLKLEKIKRGVFGAPVGKKYVVFVDDLNMPKKEEYGAQPPIELLRQFLDHNGWYNRKDQQFMKI
jgi:dynein heavy chain